MSARLTPASPLPSAVRRPAYDRTAIGTGIVHLGLGAFHRAHQAEYTEDAIEAAGGDWRIMGVSLRSAGVRDQLAPQDGLYTLVERSGEGDRLRQIGALAHVLVAREDVRAVVEALAAPATHIVSLTVTEKGYCHDPATGALDFDHPDIMHDLVHVDAPRSAIGLLVAALAVRQARGQAAPTIVSCDNLPHNGAVLRRVVRAFAQRRDLALEDWIAREVAFPETMVDRIVPATTPDDIAALETLIGARDEAMVKAEPFRQWVIEDWFAGPRPAWEAGGAQFVADVRPFEDAKLRLLNGSHSTIAYLGQLIGHDFVHQAVADAPLAAVVRGLMAEVVPTLAPTPGMALDAYCDALMVRFANPALMHRTRQIAMDGSQKLPQRLLGPIRECLKAGQPFVHLALGVAAWMRYALGRSETGARYAVDDPLSDRFAAIADASGDAARIVGAFLALTPIFGTDLPADPRFRAVVTDQLAALLSHGAAATVRTAAQERAS